MMDSALEPLARFPQPCSFRVNETVLSHGPVM